MPRPTEQTTTTKASGEATEIDRPAEITTASESAKEMATATATARPDEATETETTTVTATVHLATTYAQETIR